MRGVSGDVISNFKKLRTTLLFDWGLWMEREEFGLKGEGNLRSCALSTF